MEPAQPLREPPECMAAMGHLQFVGLAHFGHRLPVRREVEDRVVAKTAGAFRLLRDLSLHYHLDADGTMRVRLVDPEGRGRSGRVYEHWKVLRLSAGQRVALAEEITALIARYEAAQPDAGGEPFIVHAAFAPKLGA